MRVESISVALRPRLAAEAIDLGAALVQEHARSVWRSFTPLFLAFLALACATVEIAPWLPLLLIFWFKPWLDCSLLFILSRAVFGQPTHFADLWQQRAAIWRGQWLRTLFWQRLSPWRAFTQPIFQLEGQRGKAMRQRRKLLLNGQRGMAGTMQFVFANIEAIFMFALIAILLWLTPGGHRSNVATWIFDDKEIWQALLMVFFDGVAVLVLEPFFVAAGLAMYLNRRVELEAWDIEQEFRRAFGA